VGEVVAAEIARTFAAAPKIEFLRGSLDDTGAVAVAAADSASALVPANATSRRNTERLSKAVRNKRSRHEAELKAIEERKREKRFLADVERCVRVAVAVQSCRRPPLCVTPPATVQRQEHPQGDRGAGEDAGGASQAPCSDRRGEGEGDRRCGRPPVRCRVDDACIPTRRCHCVCVFDCAARVCELQRNCGCCAV
jgi:hypothetical protein